MLQATEWWLDDMYLSVPLGLPININPGLTTRGKNFANQTEAAVFLARFITELLNYQELLDRLLNIDLLIIFIDNSSVKLFNNKKTEQRFDSMKSRV